MRPLLILVSWGIATAGALAWAWRTTVGPVVFAVSDTHGIHFGDLVGFAIAYAWAIVTTMALTPERSGRPR